MPFMKKGLMYNLHFLRVTGTEWAALQTIVTTNYVFIQGV